MPIRMTGINSGLDTDSIVQALVSSYSYKKDKYKKEQTKLSWTQDVWKNLNKKVYSLYTGISNLRFASAYSTKKTTISDATKAGVSAGSGAVIGTQKLNILSVAQSGYLTGGKLDDKVTSSTTLKELGCSDSVKINLTTGDGEKKEISLEGSSTISDVVDKLKEAGVNASFDKDNHRLFISSQKTGAKGDFELSADNEAGKQALTLLGLNTDLNSYGLSDKEKNYESLYATDSAKTKNNVQKLLDDYNAASDEDKKKIEEKYDFIKNLSNAADLDKELDKVVEEINDVHAAKEEKVRNLQATKLDGQDAVIKLNGVEYTSESNSFTVNGLTIAAQAVTGDGDSNAVTITTSTDSQAIYDKVKDFLTQYNNIMKEMSSLYNADAAKGMEPLTDDEKAELSDKEVEKWEEKIKNSLLRRDSTLDGLMSSMSLAMSKTIKIGDKSYSLSSFGISTLKYGAAADNEKYSYHIDGDEDDENTSGNKDKLMAAIQQDPDTVVDFMKQMASNLYDAIGDKMAKSTTLSSAYTIYNDKQMTTQYNQYTKLIKEWEQRVTDKEDYYYKKFSKMESALATLNSTQSSLSGFFM